MTTGKISKTFFSENFDRPVFVNFQNGTFISNKIDEFNCSLYTDREDNLITTVASSKSVYSGKVSRNNELYNNFLLTRNKKTGECKLIAVDKALLSIVTQSKRKLEAEDTTWQKKVSDLNRYFGSKKTKRLTEQNDRLKVDVGNVQATLEQTAKETHVEESDIVPVKATENDSLYRPPINREATKVEDVYPLSILIPPNILSELEQSANELLNSDADQFTFCEYIKNEFMTLQKSNSSEKTHKAQLLIYINCLIDLLKQTARNISNKKFSACSYSSKVSNYILDKFTLVSATGRTRPLSMRDKCVCYILVLIMLAQGNVLNLELLTKDLKLGLKKLQDLSRILAFTFKSSKKSIVTLTLPLPPAISGATRRGRK